MKRCLATTAVAILALCLAPAAAAASPPTVIGRTILGYSVRHRPIVAYHLGNPHSRIKAVVLGQMHGDEPAGVTVAEALIHGRPVTGIDLWVIPTLNPDGRHAHRRGNAHGVDLNRNWPNHWRRLTGQYYSGRHALSEPETRALYRFLRRIEPKFLVSLHQPLYGVDTTDGGHRNPGFRRRLAHNLHLPQKPFRCWSTCYGSMTGWVTRHQPGSAITVEFGRHPSRHALRLALPRGIVLAMRGHLS